MATILIDFIVMFLRLNSGAISGDMGSAVSYMVQTGIIAIMAVVLIAGLIFGMFRWYKKGIEDTKVEKVKYYVTAFLAICMIVAIVKFDLYQFWAI